MRDRADAGVAVVEVDGEIDVFTTGMLRDGLLALVDEGHTSPVVNLGRVGFIDSTGSTGRGAAPAAAR